MHTHSHHINHNNYHHCNFVSTSLHSVHIYFSGIASQSGSYSLSDTGQGVELLDEGGDEVLEVDPFFLKYNLDCFSFFSSILVS